MATPDGIEDLIPPWSSFCLVKGLMLGSWLGEKLATGRTQHCSCPSHPQVARLSTLTLAVLPKAKGALTAGPLTGYVVDIIVLCSELIVILFAFLDLYSLGKIYRKSKT